MNSFKSFISEAISLEYHEDLNSSLWNKEGDEYILKDVIEKKLNSIAGEWENFAKIPKEAVIDVIFTGGNANYNYTKFSDIDLHIVINKEMLLPKKQWDLPFGHNSIVGEVINDYLKSKKQLWSMKHNVRIAGYPVEIYAQSNEELYHSEQGVYSILQKKWIVKPVKGNYDFNNKCLLHKVKMWERKIDNAIMSNSPEEIGKLRKRLSDMRKSALERGGEFADENLVFKALRNSNFLNRLSGYQRIMFDKNLLL